MGFQKVCNQDGPRSFLRFMSGVVLEEKMGEGKELPAWSITLKICLSRKY